MTTTANNGATIMTTTIKPKFSAGVLLSTPGAAEAFERNRQTPFEFLQRHLNGDWGDLDLEDKDANERALIDGGRLLSAYHLKDKTKIWAITEAVGEDRRRESTTFLLPSEY
jgi:hypothetical protein